MPNWGPLVVDTSVVSILFKPEKRPPEQLNYYQTATAGRELIISFQTVEELLFWAHFNNWGEKRYGNLLKHIREYNIIESDARLSARSASLRSQQKKVGHTLNSGDSWIAATALLMDCPLVTDDSDFQGIPDLEIIRYVNKRG